MRVSHLSSPNGLVGDPEIKDWIPAFAGMTLFAMTLFISIPSAFPQEQLTPAPTVLPHTTREMKTAGFWISRHPNPDEVIMSSKQIREFNQRTSGELKLTQDLLNYPKTISGEDLKKTLEGFYDNVAQEGYFLENKKTTEDILKPFKDNLNLENISKLLANNWDVGQNKYLH